MGFSRYTVCKIFVDSYGRVLNLQTGTPGAIDDRTLWHSSNLKQWAELHLPQLGRRIVDNCEIHYYILGDGVILCPYTEAESELASRADRYAYNYGHSSCRIRVEQTIGYIKNKFRILKTEQKYGRTVEDTVLHTSKTFEACCVLWNMMLMNGDISLGYDVDNLNDLLFPIIIPTEGAAIDGDTIRLTVMNHYLSEEYDHE